MKTKDLSKVYSIPLENQYSREKSLFSLECILTHRIFRLLETFNNNDIVGIKLNDALPKDDKKIPSKYFKTIANIMSQQNISSVLCDTSNRFKDRTTNAAKHMKKLFELGFSFSDVGIPFLMLDGANGKHETILEGEHRTEQSNVYIAGELSNLNGMIITSMPSSHQLAGFSGALYNLGFGMASKRGKIKLSTMSIPQVNSSKCYYCRKCLRECPTNAIYIKGRHVDIDPDLCFDCGKCVDIADYGGISYSWNATPKYFQDILFKYADSILKIYREKLLFINFIPDVRNDNENEFSEILVSKNPYAIDVETAKRLAINLSYRLPNTKYKLETINY